MQSPEMQSLLNNPRALQAMMQIQAGISQLQLEAPSLSQGYNNNNIIVVIINN